MPPKFLPLTVATLLFAASFQTSLFSAPLITEFMADNTSTLSDEDGAFSDWIEIHNPDATSVSLAGWSLTDNAANLTKWIFPPVTIDPGGFLIVFASGKNKQIPGSELHTNFSLSAGGEYLALVQSDGTTIAYEFAPAYSNQDPDRSYGLAFNGIPLVSQGAVADFQIPASGALGTTWTGSGFTSTGWSSGSTGIGFGLEVPGFTVRDVHSTGAVTTLAQADALLGGTGVASEIQVVRPVLNFLDTGGDGHFASNLIFPGGGGDNFVLQGTATIIIPTAGIWTFGINSDDGGRIRVDSTNVVVDDTQHGAQDHFGTISLSAGPHTIEAMFFETGGGAEIEIFAAPGSFSSYDTSMRLVGDTAAGGLTALTTPDGISGGGVIDTNISSQMLGTRSGAYIRIPFSVSDVNALESLSLNMRYNDGFVAYLNGTRVAAANAPAGTPDWDSTATSARASSADSFIPQFFNLTANKNLLSNGAANVLAIHGLNIASSDSSFLILPELTGGGLLAGDPFYFDSPTPGNINSPPSSQGKVEDTKFTPDRGFYDQPQSVTITTLTSGATIRYTMDGSKPTESYGSIYSGPISITQTTVLRAAAFKLGFDPTDVDTHSYLFLDQIIQQPASAPPGWPAGPVNGQIFNRYQMDSGIVNHANPDLGGVQSVKDALTSIPTISISLDQDGLTGTANGIYTHPGNRGIAWERESSIELIHPPGYADPDGNTKGFQSPCGLRIRGGFSRSTDNPKHSFRVFFRGDYGNGKLNYKLFGDEGADTFDKFDLRGPQNYSWAWGGQGQNTFIRDTWSRDLQGEMGHQYTRGRWYHLYLNGIYWGMTQTDERAEANYAEIYFGDNEFDYDVVKSFGDVTDGNTAAYQRLYNKWVAGFSSNASYYETQGLNTNGTVNPAFERLLDAQNLMDYMIITYYTGDRDGPGSRYTGTSPNNYFGIYNRVHPDGFQFFEHDSEHSLGVGDANMVTPYKNSTTFADFNPHVLHQNLADQNLEYRMEFADRVAKYCYNGGLLTDAQGVARVDRRATQIDRAVIAHSARWGDSALRNRNNWLSAVQNVRNFINGRVPTLISQLRSVSWYPSIDPPVYSQHGGHVSSAKQILINSGPGTIYYTVNGRDPREQGGGTNTSAQIFQGNTSSHTLVAAGSTWKYLDNGSDQGAAWRGVSFNDASWPSGPAQLGYGEGDEATQIGYGTNSGNKYRTTYFRLTFSASDVSTFTSLNLGVLRDDGIIVYLNGTEIARSNMPAGTVDYQTFAADVVGGGDESIFYPFAIPTSALVEGNNTLAVELHQINAGSSDASFDLTLTGVKTTSANPLLLTQPGLNTLQSRVFENGEWSALTEARFIVDSAPAIAANLVVSEIHYRPAVPSIDEMNAGFLERSEFEFIELTNISSGYIDLAGVALTLGVEFVFGEDNPFRFLAPGAQIILVNNPAAFEFRYGAGLPVAGTFSGSLSNDGEQITVIGADQNSVQDFIYNDSPPWPDSPDGGGYSLVLISPASNPNPANPFSWRNSSSIGGNPGTSDATDFSTWKISNGVTDNLSDDDRDGIAAILEYVLGGDPNVPSAGIQPLGYITPVDVAGLVDNYLVIDIRHRAGADDVAVTAEVSTDLGTWNTNTIFVRSFSNGDGSETLRFRSADPVTQGNSRFIRARASIN